LLLKEIFLTSAESESNQIRRSRLLRICMYDLRSRMKVTIATCQTHIALSIHQASTALFDNDTFALGQIKSMAGESGPLSLPCCICRVI